MDSTGFGEETVYRYENLVSVVFCPAPKIEYFKSILVLQ